MDSADYATYSTLEKRAKIFEYFLLHIGKYVTPKDFKKEYKLTSNQQRTLVRNFQWFYSKWVILSKNFLEKKDDAVYDTEYKLNKKDITYNIPTEPLKRFNYALMLTSLFTTSDKTVFKDMFIQQTAQTLYSMMKNYGDSDIRDTFLSVDIYDNFKNKNGNILSILLELSHFNQQIKLDIKSDNGVVSIEKTTIERVTINEDGSIKLKLKNMSMKLNSLDDYKYFNTL